MVRCYISGRRVAGFGYQEINALYSHTQDGEEVFLPPGKRHYYTENCGLFTNLRLAMEQIWIPQIQQNLSIPDEQLPVIWDADFFICDPGSSDALRKYMLCEINVSSVSPFPPSAVPHMIRTVRERI